ncbi:MAG: PhoH family protein [Deltaproteobacteria bacterium]|nr:MAG: PhoH family protein [Deltaproteobacteria bacterium]TDJ09676.1 MAG: PhoH family protein [Deltaproteobacteria bacterium]
MFLADSSPLILEDNAIAQILYGENDRNLRALEEEVGVKIQARGNRVSVRGPDLERKLAERVLGELYHMAAAGLTIHEAEVHQVARMAHEGASPAVQALLEGDVVEVGRRKRIIPRSANQRLYIQTIRSSDLVLGIGPAGTGKTYLAMAMAVSALLRREVSRIILTRPAVEAGEKLGYLPGTIYEKVDPYLRPLYDALHDMLDPSDISRRIERGVIEVAPLAFMRGRTFNDAFIILDEAQNTTSEQMRMFLTRLGFDSKAVVNGDVTQIDLPRGTISGLIQAEQVLTGIPLIRFVHFTEKDVVRHPLVQDVIRAYERHQNEK